MGSTLEVSFAAINSGDFTTAFAQRVASGTDFETFRDAVRSPRRQVQQVDGLWLIAGSEARGEWPRSIACEHVGTEEDPRSAPTDEATGSPTQGASEEPAG